MWPLVIPALVGGLATAMGSMVGRVILALGVGFVSYTGIEVLVDGLQENIITSVKGLPAQMVGMIGYMWIDKAVTVIFSAVSISISFKLTDGALKQIVYK